MKNVVFHGARILVTGHSGFLVTWLCHLLEIQGAEVLGYPQHNSSFSTIFPDEKLTQRFRTVFGRVEKGEEYSREVKSFQTHIVVHLATKSLVKEGATKVRSIPLQQMLLKPLRFWARRCFQSDSGVPSSMP